MNVNELKIQLINQKKNKTKEKIYHITQVTFAYNSNKIEGSTLTKEQTKKIFEEDVNNLNKDYFSFTDDSLETINHFKLFDYIIDNIDKPLSKKMIINMNKILKKNTSYEKDPKYNVGGFKTPPNIIGMINVINTSKPEDVEKDIDNLLDWYNNKDKISLEDIIKFHVIFERIHPFGDGNGRGGRIIMFKECLKNNIFPFIILDQNKSLYIRGLKEYDKDPMYLIDTCLDAQDNYKILYKMLNY